MLTYYLILDHQSDSPTVLEFEDIVDAIAHIVQHRISVSRCAIAADIRCIRDASVQVGVFTRLARKRVPLDKQKEIGALPQLIFCCLSLWEAAAGRTLVFPE
jgi:hypothetical protein